MTVEGFIRKPPHVGTQLVELPTLTKTQPSVEEVVSSDDEVKAQSKEVEEETKEESIESLIHDVHFEIFYDRDMTEDLVSTLRSVTVAISEDQEAIEILEAMVIENKLPDLLSLLESHAMRCYPRNSCGTQASNACPSSSYLN
nr:hypothetical protein CFP56_66003 [Quercus suber]